MTSGNELPQGLLAWVATITGADVTRCTRHTARREAWQIETRDASGATARYFLRIDRALAAGQRSMRNLRRETELIRALATRGIPAQQIIGWNDEHCAALQSWVPGRAELNREPRELQHRIMLAFMDTLARLHRIDIAGLDLPEFVRPTTAAEHSLLELRAVEEPGLFPVSSTATHPLAAFGKRWLINHAPARATGTVLLQGDTGPANFMFDESGVTAFVDWEWGHYGDPMEDLGNIWVRDFFYPSSGGDLGSYFRHYAEQSGFALDDDGIRYYRAHQMVRSVIGLAYLTANPDWRMPIPLNLGYAAVIDIETCRSLFEASAAAGARPAMEFAVPALDDDENSLHGALAQQLQQWIAPQIADAATADLARGHTATMKYLGRRDRYGAQFDQQELQGLRQLLGNSVADLWQGRRALIAHIEKLEVADEMPVLEHLTKVAANRAALMAPLTTAWQECRWAAI